MLSAYFAITIPGILTHVLLSFYTTLITSHYQSRTTGVLQAANRKEHKGHSLLIFLSTQMNHLGETCQRRENFPFLISYSPLVFFSSFLFHVFNIFPLLLLLLSSSCMLTCMWHTAVPEGTCCQAVLNHHLSQLCDHLT